MAPILTHVIQTPVNSKTENADFVYQGVSNKTWAMENAKLNATQNLVIMIAKTADVLLIVVFNMTLRIQNSSKQEAVMNAVSNVWSLTVILESIFATIPHLLNQLF